MNHMLDVGDVEASRSNIGGNQKARGGGGEPVQVLQSLLLVELSVEGERGHREQTQQVGQASDTVNGVAEDNRPARMAGDEIVEEEVFLCESAVEDRF